jgi:hypothetical protein
MLASSVEPLLGLDGVVPCANTGEIAMIAPTATPAEAIPNLEIVFRSTISSSL